MAPHAAGTNAATRGLSGRRIFGMLAAVCLAASALAVALAPLAIDQSYSWIANTTSESAAQGVDGAWLARLGFLTFGLAALALAYNCSERWGVWGTGLLIVFGVSLSAVAAFSHKSWIEGAPFDRTEDLLHSLAATTMGFAFALGVVAVSMQRRTRTTAGGSSTTVPSRRQ